MGLSVVSGAMAGVRGMDRFIPRILMMRRRF